MDFKISFNVGRNQQGMGARDSSSNNGLDRHDRFQMEDDSPQRLLRIDMRQRILIVDGKKAEESISEMEGICERFCVGWNRVDRIIDSVARKNSTESDAAEIP